MAHLLYGPSTASAVLRYKERRNIIKHGYQTRADNFVGKLTIASMDKELLIAETKAGLGPRPLPRCPQCGGAPIKNRGSPFDNILSLDARKISFGKKVRPPRRRTWRMGQGQCDGEWCWRPLAERQVRTFGVVIVESHRALSPR